VVCEQRRMLIEAACHSVGGVDVPEFNNEVGEKLRTTDQRFSLNGSLFWINWKNIRELIDLPCGFFAYINSAAARSRGGELEMSAAPLEGLMLNGGIGYTDSKIVSEGALDVPPVGSPIEQVAPLTGNFSARYERPWIENTSLLWRADYIYTSHSYSTTNSPLMPRLRPAYRLVGVRSGIRKDSLECAFFIKNLFDVHPNLGDQLSNGAEDLPEDRDGRQALRGPTASTFE
jgi:iron complex outermembrane receptor protein